MIQLLLNPLLTLLADFKILFLIKRTIIINDFCFISLLYFGFDKQINNQRYFPLNLLKMFSIELQFTFISNSSGSLKHLTYYNL